MPPLRVYGDEREQARRGVEERQAAWRHEDISVRFLRYAGRAGGGGLTMATYYFPTQAPLDLSGEILGLRFLVERIEVLESVNEQLRRRIEQLESQVGFWQLYSSR